MPGLEASDSKAEVESHLQAGLAPIAQLKSDEERAAPRMSQAKDGQDRSLVKIMTWFLSTTVHGTDAADLQESARRLLPQQQMSESYS